MERQRIGTIKFLVTIDFECNFKSIQLICEFIFNLLNNGYLVDIKDKRDSFNFQAPVMLMQFLCNNNVSINQRKSLQNYHKSFNKSPSIFPFSPQSRFLLNSILFIQKSPFKFHQRSPYLCSFFAFILTFISLHSYNTKHQFTCIISTPLIFQNYKDLFYHPKSNVFFIESQNNSISDHNQLTKSQILPFPISQIILLPSQIFVELEQKEIELQNMKEQYQQVFQDNINLKNQFEQDKTAIIKKYEEEQNKVKQEFDENLTKQKSQLQQALSKLDQIDKVKLEQEKQNKLELEKIQQYNKSLSFSNTYKNTNCSVTEAGKLVADIANNGNYNFCLCEQAIPKTGKIQFAFQMISGSSFMIGIGFREIMQKNNYQNCYNAGTYLISYGGYTCSHHNKDVHDKQLSFGFKTNDIIIIEVCIEHKYIKWIRQNNPYATIVLDIDTSQQLYPCVGVQYNSKIKILDSVPV
ncbi:unnamed protein product [Paramecium sonneborni]|uniref:Uncharacterized protein n=1 Tax=Paramecium sonneborni TaxID=65129 RepID=A0A8S1RK57_9CILI|nr:unnamed protein product [Paramecium sonneborni]